LASSGTQYKVRVDGKKAGVLITGKAPTDFPLPPGKHSVQLQIALRRSEQMVVTLKPGQTTQLGVRNRFLREYLTPYRDRSLKDREAPILVTQLGASRSSRKPRRSKEEHVRQRVCDSHERRAIMLLAFKPLSVQHRGARSVVFASRGR
jgi:hypothetical protein